MAKMKYIGEETATTETVAYKKEFSWKIENWQDWFSSLDIDELILSKIFRFEIEGTVHEFKLALLKYHSYDGIVDSIDTLLRLSLYYIGPSEYIIMKPVFYIPMIGVEGAKTFEAARLRRKSFSEYWMWSDHWFNCNKEDILVDGSLTFGCLAQINVEKGKSNLAALENNICEKKTWMSNLSDVFNFSIRTSGGNFDKLSDFEIVCNGKEGGRSFLCHKLVLSLGSRYFNTMFSGHFTEVQGKVEVPDISSETMAKLLQYLYTGKIDSVEIDLELLTSANKYQIEDLQAICELELASNLTKESAPMTAVAADLCGSEDFKRYVFHFVARYWRHMADNSRYEWLEKNPALLSQILNFV